MILFYLNPGWKRYIARSPHLLLTQEAEGDPECRVEWMDSEELPPRTTGFDVLVTEPSYYVLPWLTQITGAVRCCMEFDIHRFSPDAFTRLYETFAAFDIVLTPHRYARIPSWVCGPSERQRANMVMFPHCVPDEQWPVTEKPLDAIYCGMRNSPCYPFRAWVESLEIPTLESARFPGYDNPEEMLAARERFYPEIASRKMKIAGLVFGDCGYATAKYMDGPYVGSLLLAEEPNPEERDVLGLTSGQDCFYFKLGEEGRFRSVFADVATHWEDRYAHAARLGQAIICQRHSARKRLDHLKRICSVFQHSGAVPDKETQLELACGI